MLYALQKHWLANKFIYSLRHDENRSNTYSFMSYITFSIWGPMSLAEEENTAALQLFTLGGGGSVWGHASFGNFRCSGVHSGAF